MCRKKRPRGRVRIQRMELSHILRTLSKRRLGLAAVVAFAFTAAVLMAYRPVGMQPTFEPRTVALGVASKQVLLDLPEPAFVNLKANTSSHTGRTGALIQLLGSVKLERAIARASGIPEALITTEGPHPVPPGVQNVVRPSEARSAEVLDETMTYRLRFKAPSTLPIVTIRTQAPTPAEAARLADAAYVALKRYVGGLSADLGKDPRHPIVLRDMGPAMAGHLQGGMTKAVLVLGFVAVLMLGVLALLTIEVLRSWLAPPPANHRRSLVMDPPLRP